MRRGDFVVGAFSGDYGKPRPALVIQSNFYTHLPSVTLCPLTSYARNDLEALRPIVEPSSKNGLQQRSQIAIDKIMTLSRTKVSRVIGRADDELMIRVNRALALFIEIT